MFHSYQVTSFGALHLQVAQPTRVCLEGVPASLRREKDLQHLREYHLNAQAIISLYCLI